MRKKFKSDKEIFGSWGSFVAGKTFEVKQSTMYKDCWELIEPFSIGDKGLLKHVHKEHFEVKATFNIKINTRKIYE